MKVFISHQKADSDLAREIELYLKNNHKIDSYLDIVDPEASKTGDQLGEYLRRIMGTCTQLLAVVSERSKESWWVPWEIGIATEKDHPIATFARDNTILPEYLKKWPYLKNKNDLDFYAKAVKASTNLFENKRKLSVESRASVQHSSTQEFYRSIRADLGQ